MKRIAITGLSILLMLLTSSCLDKYAKELQEEERDLLNQYLLDNDITADPTASGMYYLPITEGTGEQPNPQSWVEVEFTAELVSGLVFTTTDQEVAEDNYLYTPSFIYGPSRLELSQLLPGLQEGLQYMKEGGEAKLIIPSDLAYGGTSFPMVPQYSTLIYTITLLETYTDPVQHESELLEAYLQNQEGELTTTSSGVYFIEKGEPTGDFFTDGETVKVSYTGRFLDGRVFDSNTADVPLTLTLPATNVISGFSDGFYLTRDQSEGRMIIPWDLAYGVAGSYNRSTGQFKIPPYMTLVFDVQVERY